jgi:hypothetical protein
MDDEDPFFEEPVAFSSRTIAARAKQEAKPVSRSLTRWEQQQEDTAQLSDFLTSIGQFEALPLLQERDFTWEKLKLGSEPDLLNSGIPKRIIVAVIEELKKLPNTRLGMGAASQQKKKIVNIDLKQDVDFEHVATCDLPSLPKEPPAVTSRIEYKNYMKLVKLFYF